MLAPEVHDGQAQVEAAPGALAPLEDPRLALQLHEVLHERWSREEVVREHQSHPLRFFVIFFHFLADMMLQKFGNNW